MSRYDISIFSRSFYSNSGSGKNKYLQRRHDRKGPEGYERKSRRMRDEACSILYWDTVMDAIDIDIIVKDDTIFLKGTVENREDKDRAEILLKNITGVKSIENLLTIRTQKFVKNTVFGNSTREVSTDKLTKENQSDY